MDKDYLKYYEVYRLKYTEAKVNQKKKKGIIAIDFDNTITKISLPLYILKLQWDLDPDKFSKTIPSIIEEHGLKNIISTPFLDRDFTDYLRTINKDNIKIIVVSYGVKKGIRLIIEELGLDSIFDSIITPQDLGLKDGYDCFQISDGKNKMIKLAQKEFGEEYNNVLLVDDSQRNIEQAQKNKYSTSLVKGDKGMTYQNVDDIVKFVDSF